MAIVTPLGIERKTLAEYKAEREAEWQGALGNDLSVAADTPQGQIIGIESLSLSQADDTVINTSNQLGIFTAQGVQLDGQFATLAVIRLPATATTVVCDFMGVSATLIPAGSKARTTAGDQFALDADLTLDGGGIGSAVMSAVVEGVITAPAGTLNQIVDAVPGWETVTNPLSGSVGEEQETDDQYIRRYLDSLFKNARSPLGAVRADVLALPGVVEAESAENDEDTSELVNGVLFAPHSLGVAVQGGDDTEIAQAIQHKTIGCFTNGNTAVVLPQINGSGALGPDITIRFFRVVEIQVIVTIDISINANFPADGINRIKTTVIDYFEGNFPTTGIDKFEIDGIKIGEDVIRSRLYTPVNSVPGHVVNSLEMEEFGGSDTAVLTVNFDQRAVVQSIADVIVNVT